MEQYLFILLNFYLRLLYFSLKCRFLNIFTFLNSVSIIYDFSTIIFKGKLFLSQFLALHMRRLWDNNLIYFIKFYLENRKNFEEYVNLILDENNKDKNINKILTKDDIDNLKIYKYVFIYALNYIKYIALQCCLAILIEKLLSLCETTKFRK